MANFGISEAQIVGLWLESVFWGFFLITFFMCMRSLLLDRGDRWVEKKDIKWAMVIVALLLFFFATFDVAIGLLHNIQAFILFTGPGGSDAEFTNISDWVNVVKTVNCYCQTMIGDGMLIYRCWIVWNRNWKTVAFSFLLWLGTITTAGMAFYYEITLHSRVLINSNKLEPVITSFWACSITLNILTTFLLVYKIYKVDSRRRTFEINSHASLSITTNGRRQPPSLLQRIIRIIIESGAMYTGIALITFITYLCGSNASYGTSDVEVQIVGIAFNLIIIRTHNQSDDRWKAATGSDSINLRGMQMHDDDNVSPTSPRTVRKVSVSGPRFSKQDFVV